MSVASSRSDCTCPHPSAMDWAQCSRPGPTTSLCERRRRELGVLGSTSDGGGDEAHGLGAPNSSDPPLWPHLGADGMGLRSATRVLRPAWIPVDVCSGPPAGGCRSHSCSSSASGSSRLVGGAAEPFGPGHPASGFIGGWGPDGFGVPGKQLLPHSMLGSIPGLDQDLAKAVNAHAEYGSIPRLVRKTSFDETLSHPHHHIPPAPSSHHAVGNSGTGLESGCADLGDLEGTAWAWAPDPLWPGTPTHFETGWQAQAKWLCTDRARQDVAWGGESPGCNSLLGPPGLDTEPCEPLELGRLSVDTGQGPIMTSSPMSAAEWLSQACASPRHTQWPRASRPAEDTELAGWLTGGGVSSPASQGSMGSQHSISTVIQPAGNSRQRNHAQGHETPNEGQRLSDDTDPGKSSSPKQGSNEFGGPRDVQACSIGEARKRTRPHPYSSWNSPSTGSSPSVSSVCATGSLRASSTGVSTSGSGSNHPRTQCLNCKTKETPLWRRDGEGRPLCNACGLFANLHGIPRPAALSTGVIKRRNRVKHAHKDKSHSKSACTPRQPTLKSSSSTNSSSGTSQAPNMDRPAYPIDDPWLGSTLQALAQHNDKIGLEIEKRVSLYESEDRSRVRLVN